ncbi:MAG: DUF2220 family protein [Spirochaetia bacterium]|jgi:hypothetical protein|nr:DUF2220 family protein [Spirochaetia bacterium]
MYELLEISLLARLLEDGICSSNTRNNDLIRRYETARWIAPTGRRNQWRRRPEAMQDLRQRLTALLPGWETDFNLLRTHGLDPRTPQDIEALPALRKKPEANGMLNRRNWKAAAGLGPKRKGVLNTNALLTSDWIMRLRPNKGLIAQWEQGATDLWEMAQSLTECPVPQRRWLGLKEFIGTMPSVVITCENLGAYIDLPLPEDMLAVLSPGKHIETAIELLARLPSSEWMHFGDLDPEGMAIAEQISKASGREAKLYIPYFASEYVKQGLAQKKEVIWQMESDHPVLKALAERGEGLYQEVFMLDARLADEIAGLSGHSRPA